MSDRRALSVAVEREMEKVDFGQVVLITDHMALGPVRALGAYVTESLEVPVDHPVTWQVVSEAILAAQVAGEVPPGTTLWPDLRNSSVHEPAEYVGGALAADLALEGGHFSLAYLTPDEADEYGEQEPFAWVILKLPFSL